MTAATEEIAGLTMPDTTLFEDPQHRNILLPDFGVGEALQTNQHLIVDGTSGMLIDPGGQRVYPKVKLHTSRLLAGGKLEALVLTHLDPAVVAALSGWLLSSSATVYVSRLWLNFIGDFGLDNLAASRLRPVPDEGLWVTLGSARVALVPAHFLHSAASFQVWDPVAKTLYSGALGASQGSDRIVVSDFDAHIPFMESTHQRRMAGTRALKAWVHLARSLPIEIVAPQQGACFKGREMVARLVDWCDSLVVGVDLLPDEYDVPTLSGV